MPLAALILPVIDCCLIVVESVIAALHCEFIGWNSAFILITNLTGIVVNTAVQICGSESRLYDPKINSINQLRENNFTLEPRNGFWCIALTKIRFFHRAAAFWWSVCVCLRIKFHLMDICNWFHKPKNGELWCGQVLSEWFSPRTSQCIYYLGDGTIKPLPFGPPQEVIYHDLDYCINPLEITFLVLICCCLLINIVYVCILFRDFSEHKDMAK